MDFLRINPLDDLFEQMAQNNQRLSMMLNKGLNYEDSMRILYGDTFDEAQKIVEEIQRNEVTEDENSLDVPAMELKAHKEHEPKQND